MSIAVDATKNVPLRVQVFAKGASAPAFQVGFTSVSFVQPAAANFTFTAPAGAKIKTVTPPAAAGRHRRPPPACGRQPQVIGKDWLSVAVLPASLAGLASGGARPPRPAAQSVAGGPAAAVAAARTLR